MTTKEQFELVIITAGEKGVITCERNKNPFSILSKKIEVNSTHGAGDVFAGIFCAALGSNADLKKAVEIGNEKAAFHVAK